MTNSKHIDDADFVICTSPDGWSLHAPGSSDEDIATGDAPYLVCGEGEPSEADYDAARDGLATHLAQAVSMMVGDDGTGDIRTIVECALTDGVHDAREIAGIVRDARAEALESA